MTAVYYVRCQCGREWKLTVDTPSFQCYCGTRYSDVYVDPRIVRFIQWPAT